MSLNQRSGWRRPTCGTVWLAPVSRSSGGRSAVRRRRRPRSVAASTTAGSRLATAVPEVTITAAQHRVARVAHRHEGGAALVGRDRVRAARRGDGGGERRRARARAMKAWRGRSGGAPRAAPSRRARSGWGATKRRRGERRAAGRSETSAHLRAPSSRSAAAFEPRTIPAPAHERLVAAQRRRTDPRRAPTPPSRGTRTGRRRSRGRSPRGGGSRRRPRAGVPHTAGVGWRSSRWHRVRAERAVGGARAGGRRRQLGGDVDRDVLDVAQL